ncbi:MAG: KH domain-containing protein [Dehalococcoidia bacterium]
MASKMGTLTEYLAKALVDEPDEVRVEERDDDGRVVVHLDVAESDFGRVIGRNGRVATALRSLLKVAAIREDRRASLEIGD